MLALGVVVSLIYIVLRWIGKRTGLSAGAGQGVVTVVDRISLEPKKGLWVVEAAGEHLLLASHEQGVSLLARLNSQEVERRLTQDAPPLRSFWHFFTQRRQNKPTTSSIPTSFEVVSDGKEKQEDSKDA